MSDAQNNPESAAEYLSKRPWRPEVEPDTYPSLEEIVGQAVGAGSVCWTSTPNGIFKSEQAKWIVEGAAEQIQRLIEQQVSERFPHQIGSTTVIGRECFIDKDASVICYQGENYYRRSEQAETLLMLQEKAENLIAQAPSEEGVKILREFMTRAFNAGYESHADDIAAKVNQEGFDKWSAEVESQPAAECEPVCGMAEEPEEAKQWRIQRDADKASVIDLILHYKNPADDEKRMRQIRVVME